MALPHSKTLARPPCAPEPPSGFGVRRPCGAFRNALDLRSGTASTDHLVVPKAGQGSRTPKRWRDHHAPPNLRQVLECAAPAALSETLPTFGVGTASTDTSSFRKRDRAPALQNAGATTMRPPKSARFWSAPPLRRFFRGGLGVEDAPSPTQRHAVPKAGQDSPTPNAVATTMPRKHSTAWDQARRSRCKNETEQRTMLPMNFNRQIRRNR